MKQIDLTTAKKEQIVDAIDELVYQNYKYNRQRTPSISVNSWQKIFGLNVHLMEIRYQEEMK